MTNNSHTTVPELDDRNASLITSQALELARHYLPAWPAGPDDPARGMLDIFTRLMELLIRRLNKIPEKHFLDFLDMVGVERKPGSPAEVPVTFLPAKSAPSGGYIPGGSRAATTQTDSADAHVFETRDAFYATASKLEKVVNVIPGADRYSELSPGPLPPEPKDLAGGPAPITALKAGASGLEDIPHVLYIASETLFGVEETVRLDLYISLSVGGIQIFNDSNLSWRVYDKDKKDWGDDPLVAGYSTVSGSGVINVQINSFSGTAKSVVNGIEDFWIACFFDGDFPDESQIPEITRITGRLIPFGGSIGGSFTAEIDAAFANHTPVDPSKPIYPFGQRPQFGDAFYIGSQQAFAPEVETVTLKFETHEYSDDNLKKMYNNLLYANVPEGVTVDTYIQWEYLDKYGRWRPVAEKFEYSFTVNKDSTGGTDKIKIDPSIEADSGAARGTLYQDSTADGNGIVITSAQFADIGLAEVNKEESYWIRAVIHSFDPYGKDPWMEPAADSTKPPVVIGPTFTPPIIKNITIDYTYKTDPIRVDAIQTDNNFEFSIIKPDRQTNHDPFFPFIPFASHPVGGKTNFFTGGPALYMGFDKAFGDVYISMFFHIEEALSEAGYALEQGNPHISWEYAADGYIWRPLDVADNTADLTTAGTLAFTGPSDAIKTTLFNSPLYWYRARLAKGTYNYPPVIKAIYLNTVMADNRTILREDLVAGSGNGQAGQIISLVRTPVSGGELWVREAEKPGERDEMEKNLITKEIETGGGQTEIRVQWLKVANFHSSGPRSRHYTLDAVNGLITFGDGKNGMIPPAGKDNIIMTNYRTGGGEQANKAASPLAVKELKSSLPYIDKVFNIQYAVGGSNSWSLQDAMRFGPQSLKHRRRAVTTEDYEWMVLQQFSQVARAKCIPTHVPAAGGGLSFKPGAATVIIVPKSSQPKPQPSKGLLKNIRLFLAQNALGSIFEDIHAIGPGFEQINITAGVKPENPGESSVVERRIIKNLEAFFHPITGGEKKTGWDFGRNVYKSEIYAEIERTEGVEFVEYVKFDRPGQEYIEIGDNSLGYSGSHKINMISMETG